MHLSPLDDSTKVHIYLIVTLQEECFESLESISKKINTNDVDMRSHVVLSMIKVASVFADVPDLKSEALRAEMSLCVQILLTMLVYCNCID
jgi:hypothetical protein